ncbi:hypothetical protein DSUL_100058 [Desulfovibrionales bacterium]
MTLDFLFFRHIIGWFMRCPNSVRGVGSKLSYLKDGTFAQLNQLLFFMLYPSSRR